MKTISPTIALLLGLLIGYFIFHSEDPNSKLTYGKTGFPKNCRAIVKENIDGYRLGQYSSEEIIGSIDRNCGEFGYSWEIQE